MKIGLVCPYKIDGGGGVQEIVLATTAELKRRGHNVKIITPLHRDAQDMELPDVIFVGGSVDYRSPMHTRVQVSASGDINKIDDVLAAEKFDVLHFHEPWMPVLSRQILQRSTSVNIATFHAQVPETLMSRTTIKVVTPYLKSVLSYLDVLTAVSDAGAQYAASLTKQPITIIPNGIDLEKYKHPSVESAVAKQNGEQTILFIGRLERRKGVKYLLRAYQLLTQDNPNLRLIIAGDGQDREMLELFADDLHLPNVSFLGYVSEELKLQLLAEADLFCSPAIFGESFGIVLLEAMATGTVTVAGNNAGYVGLMQGVGALSIVNSQDTPEFARRLQLLLEETPLRSLWQAWAADYVKQFAYQTIVDKYEELYEEALKTHAPKH